MKILITGNLGYVGSSLIPIIKKRMTHAKLFGFDTGYFSHLLAPANIPPELNLEAQYFGDIRRFSPDLLLGIDAIVHLAAISNDPLGNRFATQTNAINLESGKALVRAAKKNGVSKFIFASSCSVYGSGGGDKPRDEKAKLDPLTPYALSKVQFENFLKEQGSDSFQVTSLRYSTACGVSPRTRLDLVLNDFVTSALLNKEIRLNSSGNAWRPLIHVRDMALAVCWALGRQSSCGGYNCIVNVGSDDMNLRIINLATAISDKIGRVPINIKHNKDDKRSYKVSFAKYAELAPDFQPEYNVGLTVSDFLDHKEFWLSEKKDMLNAHYSRLVTLNHLVSDNLLDENLFWKV